MTPNEVARITEAIDVWFVAKAAQAGRSAASGNAQAGRRSSVTGGLHLAGFEQLLTEEIASTGATDLTLRRNRSATLAGWYRSTKNWDLLVLARGVPVLAVEFKSMEGSEGKNLNNRADEMFGVAEDAREAEVRGILPPQLRRAYIFIMEATPISMRRVGLIAAYGQPDAIFADKSYLQRMAIMLDRMRQTGLYHLVWGIGAVRNPVSFIEPDVNVGWDRFSADLRSGFAGGSPKPAPHP